MITVGPVTLFFLIFGLAGFTWSVATMLHARRERGTSLGRRADELTIFAVLVSGERVGEVTTNRNRAIALAREQAAKGKTVECWEFQSSRKVEFQ